MIIVTLLLYFSYVLSILISPLLHLLPHDINCNQEHSFDSDTQFQSRSCTYFCNAYFTYGATILNTHSIVYQHTLK